MWLSMFLGNVYWKLIFISYKHFIYSAFFFYYHLCSRIWLASKGSVSKFKIFLVEQNVCTLYSYVFIYFLSSVQFKALITCTVCVHIYFNLHFNFYHHPRQPFWHDNQLKLLIFSCLHNFIYANIETSDRVHSM